MSETAFTFPKKTKSQWVGLALGAILLILPMVIPIAGLDPMGQRMLGIFLAAICLWVTEAIPLTATAVGVIFLEVTLVSQQAIVPVGEHAVPAATYFASLANPVLILFLGGFLIADGAAKYGLDRNLAALLLKPFGGSGRLTTLGIMLITALLSMFMSNTATTATMFAMALPIIKKLPTRRERSALALSIPIAANIGGIGTPVGSPPNAIAIGALAQQGIIVTFGQWMMMALPLLSILLVVAWLMLCVFGISASTRMSLDIVPDFDRSAPALVFYAITGLTILLWMTESVHGVNSNIVGFFPVVLMLATQVMSGEDLKRLSWPVLWLVAGGIALGNGVGATGLDKWLLSAIRWDHLGVTALLMVLALLAMLMSNVISNSATANLLVPLTLGLGTTIAVDQATVAVVIALACSMGMALPISTPPNAIAYGTGTVTTKSMIITGLFLGFLGAFLISLVMPNFWQWANLIPQ
ncbi:transporter [Boudabousia liubingyangii]|uniref:Transporter n=1 Tax=Boudabousia liubingyangii TaxID=1921764 RepID=A0A1Q5PN11_9ACTO|nr:transporter [Boudabousia liubingyangii]